MSWLAVNSPNGNLAELFKKILEDLHGHDELRVLLVTHRQADPDALCAAAGLSLILKTAFPSSRMDSKIIAPQAASALGVVVCSALKIDFLTEVSHELIQNADLIVVVDTGDPALLQPYEQEIFASGATKILIDHHKFTAMKDDWDDFRLAVDPEATSTCEIVCLSFPSSTLNKEIATILLTGIMYDSQHLGIANSMTLRAALRLSESGAEIYRVKNILRNKPDRSELIARIKSAQRLQFAEIGDRFVLKSEVSSFHASVARMLLEIGADVGIAFGDSDGEARVSARSTQSFFRETQIDLARVVKEVCEEFGLDGGGHSTAASLSGKSDPNLLANRFIERIKSVLLQKN